MPRPEKRFPEKDRFFPDGPKPFPRMEPFNPFEDREFPTPKPYRPKFDDEGNEIRPRGQLLRDMFNTSERLSEVVG